jgi:DNA-binding CsgD family transcriptional regulator
MKNRNTYAVGALIGMCFLLTGSEYISWWLYGLPNFFGNTAVDLLSEGAGYLFQVAGLLLFAFFVKMKAEKALDKKIFAGLLLLDASFTSLGMFAFSAFSCVLFGMAMNLLHGAIAGYYLTRLAQYVPQQNCGMVFGLAYAFGSIGSWLLSLLFGGSFLGSPYIIVIYALMAALIIGIDAKGMPAILEEDEPADAFHFSQAILPLAGIVVVLLSITKGLGFYFPVSDQISGTVSALFTRAFYAFGLILAGYINDRNRKYGAICCLCALVFPFISFAFMQDASIQVFLWIMAYVFFGFFSVYRVVTFVDFAQKKHSLLWLAGFGLMYGRIGDALSAFGGVLLGNSSVCLILITALLFIMTILLFFRFYNRTYASAMPPEKNMETLLHDFEENYHLSAREIEVFHLIISGRSNSEIASDLYIADSTVKFHVKNILKKAECSNRTELIAKFKKES